MTPENDPEPKLMNKLSVALIAIYVTVLSIILLYGLAKFWPTDTSAEVIFVWTIPVSVEARMILIVGMAGALGSLVHVLRSFYWYLGNRELVQSWWAKYVFTPFEGATLGIIFYLVIRGGFFAPQATVSETVPFTFVAVAALVGMFAEAAISKLKEVAETLLKAPPKGEDATTAKKPATLKDE
jgi:hypothetical protein